MHRALAVALTSLLLFVACGPRPGTGGDDDSADGAASGDDDGAASGDDDGAASGDDDGAASGDDTLNRLGADALSADAAPDPHAVASIAPAWLVACKAAPPPSPPLSLRWSKFYPGETPTRVQTGLLWTLHWLGATLPAAKRDAIVTMLPNRRLRLDLGAAGLPAPARCVLGRIGERLAASEEHAVFGAVDVGRFVALAIGVPRHYYAATDAAPSYPTFVARHPGLGEAASGGGVAVLGVGASLVALGARHLAFVAPGDVADLAWAAREGDGDDRNFEVLDALGNGALRYAVYGPSGGLVATADPGLSLGGKPSRCLWCHEGTLTPLLTPDALGPGGLDHAALQARLGHDRAALRALFASGGRAIDPTVRDEHSQGELLYTGFLEPSPTRLADEWQLPRAKVLALLSGLPTHHEDIFHVDQEPVYHRHQVDALSPYQVVPAPRSLHFAFGADPDLLD